MAFTAGSVELAKAQRLGQILAHLVTDHYSPNGGLTGATGSPIIEKYARRFGFGITGLTTGVALPPFGTVPISTANPTTAALQNPRGETMANGITLGTNTGYTVGIFLKKFVRSGADYQATVFSGVTLATSYTSGNTFTARGPINVSTNDRIVFSDAVYIVASGQTNAAAGGTAQFRVYGPVTSTYATGAAFDVTTVGVTRGTSGVAGTTFESYPRNTVVHAGFTAAVYFFGSSTGETWAVS